MTDEQPSFIRDDKELLEVVFGIDPKILTHFRLVEHPYRGGPDFRYLYPTYSSAEICWFEPGAPLGNPSLHEHIEQGRMIPLDFLHIRTRGGIGKNDLPGSPSPQGPAHPLEAQRGFRQGHSRRGHVQPAGLHGLEEHSPPQTQGETGQMHKAQDGQRCRTLVVPQAKMLFQVTDGPFD